MILVMGPSPDPARDRPEPVHSFRDKARKFEKDPGLNQAQDQFLRRA